MRTNVPINPEALVAMRTLVQAGVSDEAIGRALRDLLLAGSDDILTTAPSGRLMEETLPSHGTPTTAPRFPGEPSASVAALGTSTAAVPGVAGSVVLKVRFSEGSASNVTIPAQLLQSVAKKLGSEEAARQKVRDLARAISASTSNRSGRIQIELATLAAQP